MSGHQVFVVAGDVVFWGLVVGLLLRRTRRAAAVGLVSVLALLALTFTVFVMDSGRGHNSQMCVAHYCLGEGPRGTELKP